MTDTARSRPPAALIWALCLLAGLLVGVSGFSADSNHPTYLPPGLRLADPGFLAGDWWLNSARHYHLAFFRLVALLARFGVLEVGLAVLNVLAVAAAMFGCYRIVRHFRAERPLAALVLVIALTLASYGFCTVGSAFLFTPSLQPSTVATSTTILAMAAFLERRLGPCGLWLGVAGLFHANFLVVNLAAFGLAYALAEGLAVGRSRWRELGRREVMLGALRLLGPSLAVAAITLPLILSIQAEQVSPAVAARADWIFFHFAVPFHYWPRGWLVRFLPFLGLQALGLVWTARAVPDEGARRVVLALQIAFAAMIWTASALTTLVFIPAVSRLFVWRLAPFALLLAALLAVVGMLRVVAGGERDAVRLRLSLYALPLIAVGGAPLVGQWLPTRPVQPMLVIWAGLLGWAMLHQRAAAAPKFVLPLSCAALVFGALTQPSPEPRYSLLTETPGQREQAELFAFVASTTPQSAQFLIPPTLDQFRLRTGRAVVVDLKALPLNRSGVAEWYRRLEDLSGTRNPVDPAEVALGYATLDTARLERLRVQYGISYAVLRQPNALQAPGWHEVFRNGGFRVLAYTGGR